MSLKEAIYTMHIVILHQVSCCLMGLWTQARQCDSFESGRAAKATDQSTEVLTDTSASSPISGLPTLAFGWNCRGNSHSVHHTFLPSHTWESASPPGALQHGNAHKQNHKTISCIESCCQWTWSWEQYLSMVGCRLCLTLAAKKSLAVLGYLQWFQQHPKKFLQHHTQMMQLTHGCDSHQLLLNTQVNKGDSAGMEHQNIQFRGSHWC